ncbi:MAG: DNA alkylation repair protein [Candidatus Pacebacteria bacterium]|nr:DNA alkylation repair protein [Candidatus Paceibacterota bacterium]MCF7862740.1 DNA alkylation repair protein [Candidatus Paceibacterota bacterium]
MQEFSLKSIEKDILAKGDKNKAQVFQRFFKTGKGEYGYGDVFIGITVPESRKIASKYMGVSLKTVEGLLKNKIHEVRLIALIILVNQYKKGDAFQKEKIKDFYLKNTKHVNNWDLVDTSAYNILGKYLTETKNKTKDGFDVLLHLSDSKNLWEQRIAVVATFAFIKNNDLKHIFVLAEKFLNHKHDLIHKAVGWMLREAGKRDLDKLLKFLNKNVKKMPRTMLRYSIEKLPEKQRLDYLKK